MKKRALISMHAVVNVLDKSILELTLVQIKITFGVFLVTVVAIADFSSDLKKSTLVVFETNKFRSICFKYQHNQF